MPGLTFVAGNRSSNERAAVGVGRAAPCRRAARRPGARSPARARSPGRPRGDGAAVEAVEEVRQVVGGDAAAVVADATPAGAGDDLDDAAGGECRAALSSRLLTARASRSGVPSTTAGSSAASKRTPGAWRRARVDRLGDQLVEPHVLALGLRLVAARELDQVGDERAQLLGLLLARRPAAARARPAAAPRTRPAPRCSCAAR